MRNEARERTAEELGYRACGWVRQHRESKGEQNTVMLYLIVLIPDNFRVVLYTVCLDF